MTWEWADTFGWNVPLSSVLKIEIYCLLRLFAMLFASYTRAPLLHSDAMPCQLHLHIYIYILMCVYVCMHISVCVYSSRLLICVWNFSYLYIVLVVICPEILVLVSHI